MSTAPTRARGETVVYEQAVYGSFSFWDQGYAILAQSPGCRKEWLSDFRQVCQKFGERPPGSEESSALFATRLPSGPWAIVGVSPQGRDDAGRPGALAFHAIFLKGSDYRHAGASPFAFVPLLRDDWTADDRTLPTGGIELPETPLDPPDLDVEARAIARAIEQGRRVMVESPVPIEPLAARVWLTLHPRTRAKASLATWAFSNANQFDLAGMPRVQRPVEAPSVELADLLQEQPPPIELPVEPRYKKWVRRLIWTGCVAFCVFVIIQSWLDGRAGQ